MVPFLYVVTLLSATIGGLVVLLGVGGAHGAPQEAAAAAIGLALAVIPYVFTRSVQISRDRTEQLDQLKRIASLLEGARSSGSAAPPVPARRDEYAWTGSEGSRPAG
jgi:hypothetical protein